MACGARRKWFSTCEQLLESRQRWQSAVYLPYCAESLPNGWGYLCFMSVFYEALAE